MKNYAKRGLIGIFALWVFVAVVRCANYFQHGKRLADQWNAQHINVR